MRLRDQPKVIKEALCVYEAFRRLGFLPDHIFAHVQEAVPVVMGTVGVGLQVFMVLRLPTGQVFSVTVGSCPMTEDGFREYWPKLVEAYNNGGDLSQRDMEKVWPKSFIRRNSVMLIAGLLSKGIAIPTNVRSLN